MAVAACNGGDDEEPVGNETEVASVRLVASAPTVPLGGTITLAAEALTSSGAVLMGHVPAWSASPPGVVILDVDGANAIAHGESPGSTAIRATIDGKHQELTITVTRPAVARVAISAPASRVVRETVQLTARTFAANDAPLAERRADWSTTDAAVATVGEDGMLRARGAGTMESVAPSEGIVARAPLTVAARGAPLTALRSSSAGSDTAARSTRQARGWCWGSNARGQLGDGTQVTRLIATRVSGENRAVPGYRTWADTIHAPIALRVVRVGAGSAARHAYGGGAGGSACCWGRNADGQLGSGRTAAATGAVEVQRGSLQLEHAAAGAAHTCALTTTGAAYCWESNAFGRLGTGTTAASFQPMPVRRAP